MKTHSDRKSKTAPPPVRQAGPPEQDLIAERLILLQPDGRARIGNGGTVGLNRLMICDDNGKIFINLEVNESGKPVMTFLDNGVIRAALGVIDDEVGLFLCDGKEAPKASLTVTADGKSALKFHDTAGQIRLLLGLGPDGGGVLLMSDKQAAPRLSLMNTHDEPTLWLLNNKGKVVWEATAESAPPPPATQAQKAAPRRRQRSLPVPR